MNTQVQRDHRRDAWDHFWKDKDGRVVVYQHPNFLLIGWLVLTLGSLFTTGKISDILWYVALAVLAVWGVWEVAKGINYFRRLMGAVVLLLTVLALLKIGS